MRWLLLTLVTPLILLAGLVGQPIKPAPTQVTATPVTVRVPITPTPTVLAQPDGGLIGSKSLTAYKWVYEQVVGPVPAGLTLDHMCGNVSCCDWQHLDPCTLEENNRREPLRKAAFAEAWRVRGVGAAAAD